MLASQQQLKRNVLTPHQYPAINNAPLPADAGSSESFNNLLLFALLAAVPGWLAWKLGGGLYTTLFFAIFTTLPILIVFWTVASRVAPRKNEKARYPGKGVEHYLDFHSPSDRSRYRGKNKIPMETFHEMYFKGEVDFKGDALEIMEYRHDWANFNFTFGLFKFFLTGFIPEMIMHTRSQGAYYNISYENPLTVQTRSKSATTTTAATTSTPGSLALA